jgi:hypothetical protein
LAAKFEYNELNCVAHYLKEGRLWQLFIAGSAHKPSTNFRYQFVGFTALLAGAIVAVIQTLREKKAKKAGSNQ